MKPGGFDERAFRRDVQAIRREFRKGVEPAMQAGSEALADNIRAGAPVRTGRLKASVEVKPVRRRKNRLIQDVSVTGGHDEPFVAHVEYGDRHHAADPFIRPAVDHNEPLIIARIERAVGTGSVGGSGSESEDGDDTGGD